MALHKSSFERDSHVAGRRSSLQSCLSSLSITSRQEQDAKIKELEEAKKVQELSAHGENADQITQRMGEGEEEIVREEAAHGDRLATMVCVIPYSSTMDTTVVVTIMV